MSGPESIFRKRLSSTDRPRVLEIGTKQWVNGVSTHHGAWLPENAQHVMSDITDGADVDVVSDAHDLKEFEDEFFDAFIAVSVWEHIRKPWIAASAANRILKPGGLLYVATHFTFPVHGYPSDYTRWTDNGLLAIFDFPEWTNQVSEFSFPCKIQPPKTVKTWNASAPAYLNVAIFAEKNSQ